MTTGLIHHFFTMACNVGALERALRGQPVDLDARSCFDPEEPFATEIWGPA